MYSSVSVILDASNISWEAALTDKEKPSTRVRPPLRGLVMAVNYFEPYLEREAVILAVAPAWWDRCGQMAPEDDQTAYDLLKREGILVLAPEKTHDDLFILGCAWRDGQVLIVSNDLFRDHQQNLGLNIQWYEEHRVGFRFHNDNFIPDENQIKKILGSIGTFPYAKNLFQIPEMWETPIKEQPNTVRIFREITELSGQNPAFLIGKGGMRIKAIQSKYGANIVIKDNKVIVSALTPERVYWSRIELLAIPSTQTKIFEIPTSTNLNPEIEKPIDRGNLMEIEQPKSFGTYQSNFESGVINLAPMDLRGRSSIITETPSKANRIDPVKYTIQKEMQSGSNAGIQVDNKLARRNNSNTNTHDINLAPLDLSYKDDRKHCIGINRPIKTNKSSNQDGINLAPLDLSSRNPKAIS